MRSNHSQLAKELREAGASNAEITELLPIASRLSQLRHRQTIATVDRAGLSQWLRILKLAVFTLSGLALGMFLVVMSQTALPTSLLYPIQKLSDGIAVGVNPQYRAIIMMKRAQQVNQLVAEHASSAQVLATLNDYTSEANIYKSSPHADYAAFDFCKTNLQQAALAASPPIRKAISASLQSLDTT
jgi:hypothetical protein